MKAFWNERFAAEAYAYGTEPNRFFQEQLDQLAPGHLLMPAEGEGRNAVYAAQQGWEVTAFDISEAGQKKALQLAQQRGVQINYQVGQLAELDFAPESFDAIGLIFAHFPPALRPDLHQQLSQLLRPGGHLILEAFHKGHLAFNRSNPQAGGPKDAALLYDAETLRTDFPDFEFLLLEEIEIRLEEGQFHVGQSAVIRLLAQKKSR